MLSRSSPSSHLPFFRGYSKARGVAAPRSTKVDSQELEERVGLATVLQVIARRTWEKSRPWRDRRGLSDLRSYDRRLPVPRHPAEGAFILKILEQYRPKSIVELGSGDSSIWFASYAAKAGAEFVSFDQSAEYQEKWIKRAREHGPVTAIVSECVAYEDGRAHYADLIPDAELIFVDGPSWKYAQPCGLPEPSQRRVIGVDVPRLLQQGGRPKVIIVETRFATTDAIRAATGNDYLLLPQFTYALQDHDWRGALGLRDQTVFVRRA